MKKTFDQYTETWFDGLAELASQPEHKMYVRTLLASASHPPTKRNLRRFYELVFANAHPATMALASHVEAVYGRKFRKEFRFAFGESNPRTGREGFMKCSAASALFSLIRQALTYHD